ncbi:MAG: glycosyltransferase family 4 protein [bacterium]
MNLRLCYVGDGLSKHNHYMLPWFAKRGCEVHFLTDRPASMDGVFVHRIAPERGLGPLRHVLAAINVRRRIAKIRPDIMHGHNITGYGYWAALSGFHPLVLTAWGADVLIQPKQSRLVRSAVRWSLNRADLITTDARDLSDATSRLLGRSARIVEIQWGVEVSRYRTEPLPEARQRLNPAGDFLILSMRRMIPYFNIDRIIGAFAEVHAEIPNTRLICFASGPERPHCERLAQDLGLGDSIRFLDWVGEEELIDWLSVCDLFVSIPDVDSTPHSLLMAFAAGLPVIVSDLPAYHEWVTDGENGLLVTPQDENALARAMIELLRDPDKRTRWGYRNRSLVEEKGDRDTEMERLADLYRELIERKNSG